MSEEKLKSFTPKEAHDFCAQDSSVLLIDIRSSMEYLFVGHPKGAAHVPWIDEPDWVVNPEFVTEIRKLMLGGVVDNGSGNAPVVLICRSGKRSKEAAKVLITAGLNNIYYINEGFEGDLDENHQRSTIGGWRYHQLPWEQS